MTDAAREGSDALSVSAALGLAKRQLEDVTVRLIGEVSEVSANARYKAVYFTVKDEKSSLPCMMWNNRYAASGIELAVGALVELVGRFTLYAAKGRMNFDVFSVELAGEGRLRMQVANIVKRLDAEGLLAPARKRALPAYPERIGLVTSPRGAAVYDVLRTLRRRFPLAEVVFAGVGVEGAGAPAGIMEGLAAVQGADVDVVLLVRGGGSFEDLMPFNDEGLARFVAAMDVPVVTGIGHEPDTSVVDLVSDVRASTPTAAAEAVVPASADVAAALAERASRSQGVVGARLASTARHLDRYALLPLFREPMRLFQDDAQAVDDLTLRLGAAIPTSLARSRDALDAAKVALRLGLASVCAPRRERLAQARSALAAGGRTLSAPFEGALASRSAALQALSPLAVLARGYAIARDADGCVMGSVGGAAVGDEVSVQVSDGVLACAVRGIDRQDMALEDMDG